MDDDAMSKPDKRKVNRENVLADYVGFVRCVAADFGVTDGLGPMLGALGARQWAKAVKAAKVVSATVYGDSKAHRAFNQVAALVKKVPFEDNLLRPQETALAKYWATETRCKRVNLRLTLLRRRMLHGHTTGLTASQLQTIQRLEAMRLEILSLIGETPPVSWLDECDFTSGSSVGVSGSATHVARKLTLPLTIGPAAVPYFKIAVHRNVHLREALGSSLAPLREFSTEDCRLFQEVSHNKLDFVSKTAETDRCIAIEPTGNAFLQNGLGRHLMRLLLRWGVNLRDQGRNQRFARIGSFLESIDPFATIDLASASDSISSALVAWLFPPAWVRLMRDLRSPEFKLNEASYRFEKFVTMGNGFCFPLQSIIYTAALRSVCRLQPRDYAVYGDDIIVRQSSALHCIEVLRDIGFKTNTDKTFVHGLFKESCGADYFDGVDVRPYTLDFIPAKSRDWIKVANGYAFRFGDHYNVTSAWSYAVGCVHPKARFLRPIDGPDDSAITAPLDLFMASRFTKWIPELWTWAWKEHLSMPVSDPCCCTNGGVDAYAALRGSESEDTGLPKYTLRLTTRDVARWNICEQQAASVMETALVVA